MGGKIRSHFSERNKDPIKVTTHILLPSLLASITGGQIPCRSVSQILIQVPFPSVNSCVANIEIILFLDRIFVREPAKVDLEVALMKNNNNNSK